MTSILQSAAPLEIKQMRAYLKEIASHLLNHWTADLKCLAETTKWRMSSDERQLTQDLRTEWNATLATDGVCKSFVFINHQWVLKLGKNAIDEARDYNDFDSKEKALLVPTIQFSNIGCLQVKTKTIDEFACTEDFLDLATNPKNAKRRQKIWTFISDAHRNNLGFIDDLLYCFDFAEPGKHLDSGYGSAVTANCSSGDYECSCLICRQKAREHQYYQYSS